MLRTAGCLLLLFGLAGCVTTVRPTIAHVHVGHSITGWADTPDKAGLLTVARRDAAIAVEHARYAVEGARQLAEVRLHVGHVVHALDPTLETEGPGSGYGLLRALNGFADHLRFAVEAPDASANLRAGVGPVLEAVATARRDAELVLALARDARATDDSTTAVALALEIQALCVRNAAGVAEAARRLEAVLAREQPPYRPVEQRYLFGLIRLPSGGWDWRPDLDNPGGYRYGGYQ